MSDQDSRQTLTPRSGYERITLGFYCDIHRNESCPYALMEFTGEVHKMHGNAFFCPVCPVFQAIIERHGMEIQ